MGMKSLRFQGEADETSRDTGTGRDTAFGFGVVALLACAVISLLFVLHSAGMFDRLIAWWGI